MLMSIIKENLSSLDEIKQTIEWFSLAGVDEVIQPSPQNHLINLTPASDKEVLPQAYTQKNYSTEDIDFESCLSLEELEKTAKESKIYHSLAKTATHMLFGEGSENAKILIIAEQPGREEDLSGKVFSGKKAQIIRNIVAATGLQKDDFYYTYVSKWRPPGGRKLSPLEQKNLSKLLKKQINIIMPQTIVTLGEYALAGALLETGFNLQKNTGKLTYIENEVFSTKIAFLPLFHEESLLKTPQLKKATWLSIVNCKGDLIRQ